MTPHNLFSLLVERLMLNCDQLTMATYNVLFEVSIHRKFNAPGIIKVEMTWRSVWI